MNNIIFIIAQIIGFVAFLISLSAYHKNKKEKILSNMLLSNILDLTHYLLLSAYSGCITKILAICRNLFVMFKEKNKILSSNIFMYMFVVIYIIAAIYTYTNILSILPLVAAIIYTVAIWNGNETTLKKAALVGYFLWLIYNALVFSISGVLSNLVSIISLFFAIKNSKK